MNIELAEGVELFDHQMKTLQAFASHKRFASYSEMGSGKTLPTALIVEGLLQDKIVDRFILIMPKALTHQWVEVFKKQMVCSHKIHLHTGPSRFSGDFWGSQIIVTTFQTFVNDLDSFVKLHDAGLRVGVVIDESSQLRNPTSKRARRVATYAAKRASRVYLLSGNPSPNGYANWFIPMYILCNDKYPSLQVFEKKHCTAHQGKFKHVAELEHHIRATSVRFMKEQCLDLPPKHYIVEELEMEPAQTALYTQLVEDMFLELPEGRVIEAFDTLPMITRCMQLASNPRLLGFDIDSPKFEMFAQDLDSVAPDKKIVVFCYYLGTGYMLKEIAEKQGRKVAQLFDAKTLGGGKFERNKKMFIEDPECTVLLAHPRSAGLGLNLQMSNLNIHVEFSYDLELYDQSCDRSHRPGLAGPLTIKHYACRGTIEPKILMALQAKKNLVHTTFRDPVQFRKFLQYEEAA